MRALIFLIVVSLTSLLGPSAYAQTRTPQRATGVHAVRLYNAIGRPALVELIFDAAHSDARLVILDADGQSLADITPIRPGRLDLAERWPDLWSLNTPAYAQLVLIDTPVGAPLVIHPMLSRQVPVTNREVHPLYGNWYTRIVGWRDENVPEPEEPETFNAPEGTTFGAQDNAAPGPTEVPVEDVTGEPTNRTGVRLYEARDVIMRTSDGTLRIAMAYDAAPNTACNFVNLVDGGFYDGVIFHRIVPFDRTGRPFVIQGGDPSKTGDGAPGYWLPIEPSTLEHTFGVISMARADDPDSAGSQFFFCLSREGTARLDGQYCAFGYAVEGRETILTIANTPLADAATGAPQNPPVILEATTVAAPPREPGVNRLTHRVTQRVIEPNIAPAKTPDTDRVGR
ncbi:MAG: peptidylprolyl isomerase [Phycisphaerales bacterium]|nr:peptidylprolyl isomerase [Phycisphaerales bacterium]